MANPQQTNRKKNSRPRFYKRKGFWLSLMLLAVIAGVSGWMVLDTYTREYRNWADSYNLERINDLEIPSLILDRNGKEIGRFFVQNRSVIPIDKVPNVFIDTLRAGEDARFLTHKGVDYIGILRAIKLNLQGNKQGASTITQQLARNAYNLKDEALKRGKNEVQRKIAEIFLAMRIEKRYTKSEILEFYLNRIYFGSGFYGIRSASLGYFGKEPADLTTAECASIVTLIKNPNALSPLNDPVKNRKGRNYVLQRMKEEGMITASEFARLKKLPLGLNPKPLQRGTTHLYERVADAVGAALGEDALESGGFTIHTTILAEAQEAAEKELAKSLARAEAHAGYRAPKYEDYRKNSGKPPEYLQGAVLMIDHETGEVLAHVGGRDYRQAPYDFIEMGKRPLGTAFFPFLYAAGLERGLTPATVLEDEPMDNRSVMVGGREGILGEWGMEVPAPVYDKKITARRALECSKIAATVRFSDLTGLKLVAETACKFGLPFQKTELLPRMAVGFDEVSLKQAVRAMAVFPMGGRLAAPNLAYVDRIENAAGRVVYRRTHEALEQTPIIDEATAWQIHSMLAGSLYRGSSKGALDGLLEKPFNGAGKGGTTPDFRDTWFIGYNKRITCGVWTGFLSANGEPIYQGAFSRDLAMPVWQAVMNAATPSFGRGTIPPATNVVEIPVCSVSGQRATQFCQQYVEDPATGVVRSVPTVVTEYFRKGTETLPFCGIHSGSDSGDNITHNTTLLSLPSTTAVPIRPKGSALLGDDPYHAELPGYAATTEQPGFAHHRTNVLDSLDLGDVEESIPLRHPKRLQIMDE